MVKIISSLLVGSFITLATFANAQLNFAEVKLRIRDQQAFVNSTEITSQVSSSVEYTTITTVIGPTSTETLTLCKKCIPKVTTTVTVVTKTISGTTVTVTEPCEVTYTPASTSTVYHGGSTVTITVPKTQIKSSTVTTTAPVTIYTTVTITKSGGSIFTLTIPCTTDETTVTTTTSSAVKTYTKTSITPVITETIEKTQSSLSAVISTSLVEFPTVTTIDHHSSLLKSESTTVPENKVSTTSIFGSSVSIIAPTLPLPVTSKVTKTITFTMTSSIYDTTISKSETATDFYSSTFIPLVTTIKLTKGEISSSSVSTSTLPLSEKPSKSVYLSEVTTMTSLPVLSSVVYSTPSVSQVNGGYSSRKSFAGCVGGLILVAVAFI